MRFVCQKYNPLRNDMIQIFGLDLYEMAWHYFTKYSECMTYGVVYEPVISGSHPADLRKSSVG